MEEDKLEVMGTNILPTIKELSFKVGIWGSSLLIGYLMVSGKYKSCLDFYGIMKDKVGSFH
jgi:hypothetical protein